MRNRYPQRHNNHDLETVSERYFNNALPKDWVSHKHPSDYGVDLIVEIFENGFALGAELLVQLKSSQKASDGSREKVILGVSTYNYLWDKLQVTMLVKFVEEVNEAYWILVKDIPEPNQENKTFTVFIPKANTLSTINWNELINHIISINNMKLRVRPR